ncbi:hypothetical protein MPER_05208, partial [Moniliophthora perniciosa FA553]
MGSAYSQSPGSAPRAQREPGGSAHRQAAQEDIDVEAQPHVANAPDSGTIPQRTIWKGVAGVFSRASGSMEHYLMECSWNHMLIISSLLSAVLSVTPYLYLMKGHWDHPVSWVFPLLRSFGSFLCILVLQRRIQCIANITLLWLRAQRRYHFKDEIYIGAHGTRAVLEDCIHEQFGFPRKPILYYLQQQCMAEKPQLTAPPSDEAKAEHQKLESLLALDWHLVLYHVIMLIGMGMLVAGY